jgi:hypothetical protein
MRRNITTSGADQLRKLATNEEGISLAGRNEGAPSKGTESAIVLRVVSNRARMRMVNERRVVHPIRCSWHFDPDTPVSLYTLKQ